MPTDTTQVLEAAEKLSQLIAQHPAIEKFKRAQQAVTSDPDASRLMADFDRQLKKLVQQQQQGIPVTDAQQQSLESLQTKIVSHIKIKALNLAQMEYIDLRRRIGQTLDKVLQDAAAAKAPPAALA